MLSSVSPVITGAEAASPHPTTSLSASIRTNTLSACRTSSPAMTTGLSIGRLTAIGSIVLICTPITSDLSQQRPPSGWPKAGAYSFLLQFSDAGLIDDIAEQGDFLGHPRPGSIGTLRPHLEAGFIELLFHL